jgi:hypothetical protein
MNRLCKNAINERNRVIKNQNTKTTYKKSHYKSYLCRQIKYMMDSCRHETDISTGKCDHLRKNNFL